MGTVRASSSSKVLLMLWLMVDATVKSEIDFGAGFLTRFPGPNKDVMCY